MNRSSVAVWDRVTTLAILLATIPAWFAGAALRDSLFGKHLGIAAAPMVAVLVLWAPGLIATAALRGILAVDGFVVGRWLAALAVNTLVWSPVFARLRERSSRDRTFLPIALIPCWLGWVVISDIALGQARGSESEQYLTLLAGSVVFWTWAIRRLRRA